MSVLCYLNFDGNASEALAFYQDVFKTKEPEVLTYGAYKNDPNYQAPEEIKDLVMHAEIIIFDSVVMVSDTPKGFGFDFVSGNNFSLAVTSDRKDLLKTSWDLLKVGGKVITDLGEQPFVPYYGYLIDKFGVGWQFISSSQTK